MGAAPTEMAVPEPGFTRSSYLVMGVPSLAGAVQFTVSCLSPKTSVGPLGMAGRASGVQGVLAVLHGLGPAVFTARTLNR